MAKVKRKKIPAMSSRKLIKLLGGAGAVFDRQGKGDHGIYRREVNPDRYNKVKSISERVDSISNGVKGKVMKAPVLQGRKELPPEYSLMVFKQLGAIR